MSSLKIGLAIILFLAFFPLNSFSQSEANKPKEESLKKEKKSNFLLVFKCDKFEIHRSDVRLENGDIAVFVKTRLIYPFFSKKDFLEIAEMCNQKVKELFGNYKLVSVRYYSDTKVDPNDTIPGNNIKVWCLTPDYSSDKKASPIPIPNPFFRRGPTKATKELLI